MAEPSFDVREAYRAEKYVNKRYGYLPNSALHVYNGLKFLEEMNNGFCRQLTANFRDIAAASNINKNTVKSALLALAEHGLIKLEIGSSIKDDRLATTLTRVSIDDLKSRSLNGDGTPQELAVALNRKPFIFNGKLTNPQWSVGTTGRVCSSRPNIQGMKANVRLEGLLNGLPAGNTLIYADIKSADPTVIKHILGVHPDSDLYAAYMKSTGCDRQTAKKRVNMLAYSKNSLAVFEHWPDAAKANPVLSDYVRLLHDYKKKLAAQAQKSRSVTTMTGREIVAEKGMRLHPGRLFSWKVQGTVADIVNAAALELIKRPDVSAVLPLHDALYVVMAGDDLKAADRVMRAQASKAGIQINTDTTTTKPRTTLLV